MAIVDNTLGFSIKKTIDNIIINKTNPDETIIFTATLFLQQNCSTNSFVQVSDSEEVEEFVVFQMPKVDGTYKVRITITKLSGEFIYKEYSFTTYVGLLKSFINDAKKLLCDSNCNDCNDAEDKKDLQARVVLNMLSFYILNKETYSKFFNLGLSCIQCTLLDALNCNRIGTSFYGKKEDDIVYKRLVGYLYFIFYLGEKYTYTCCPEQIDKFFKTDSIFKCLRDINLDISCIETNILSDPNFSMEDGVFIDLTPDVQFPPEP